MSSSASRPQTNERSDGNDVGFAGFTVVDQSAQDPKKKVTQIRYQCGYQGGPLANGVLPFYYAPAPMLTWSEPQLATPPSPPVAPTATTWTGITVTPGQGSAVYDVAFLWVHVTCADGTTASWFWNWVDGSQAGLDDGTATGKIALIVVPSTMARPEGRQALAAVSVTWDGTTLHAQPGDISTTLWDQKE